MQASRPLQSAKLRWTLALVVGCVGWAVAAVNLGSIYGRLPLRLGAYLPAVTLSVAAFLWLSERLSRNWSGRLKPLLAFLWALCGWLALYWASLAFCLALYSAAALTPLANFFPSTLALNRMCLTSAQVAAVLCVVYYAALLFTRFRFGAGAKDAA